jgi:hypothetical protein
MSACNVAMLEEIIGRGLVAGLGDERQTCIEGAISLACGGDLSDSPPCVAQEDREYAISVNDAPWSSPAARAEALLPLALAQVGTAGSDRQAWVERLVIGTVRRVLPMALTAAGVAPEIVRACRDATTLGAAARAAAWAAERAAVAWSAARAAARAAAERAAGAAAARAAKAAAWAATGAATGARDAILRESVAVALDAYRAEGR